VIEFAAGAALGALGAWASSRLIAESAQTGGVRRSRELGPHVLPEPALGWLLRANGALGIWINEIAPDEDGPVRNGNRRSAQQVGKRGLARVGLSTDGKAQRPSKALLCASQGAHGREQL